MQKSQSALSQQLTILSATLLCLVFTRYKMALTQNANEFPARFGSARFGSVPSTKSSFFFINFNLIRCINRFIRFASLFLIKIQFSALQPTNKSIFHFFFSLRFYCFTLSYMPTPYAKHVISLSVLSCI